MNPWMGMSKVSHNCSVALGAQNYNFTLAGFPFNCMGWTPDNEAFFVGLNLGPSLATHGFDDIKIMIMDDQRIMLPKWVETVSRQVPYKKIQFWIESYISVWKVLAHPEAKKYVAGIAFHWYGNILSPPNVLSSLHVKFPNHFILATEACEGK